MSLNTFKHAYIECVFWSGTDAAGTPLEDITTDIDADTLAGMNADCVKFYADNSALWKGAYMSDEQAGHDFWLTRNKHGAGFWDRGLGLIGENLTAAAHAFGEVHLYVGDDGRVYL